MLLKYKMVEAISRNLQETLEKKSGSSPIYFFLVLIPLLLCLFFSNTHPSPPSVPNIILSAVKLFVIITKQKL